MKYSFFNLLEEAHSHGRDMGKIWSEAQSFTEFLKQHNLVKEYSEYKNKQLHPQAAKNLKQKGYSIRQIASFLGYKHPGSISNLLNKK